MKLIVTGLYCYPIKSLAGIALSKAHLSDKGFIHDRKWMLVDHEGMFITQREVPELVLFEISLQENGIELTHPKVNKHLFLPFEEAEGLRKLKVQVWDDQVDAVLEPEAVGQWFSSILGREVHLARFSKQSERLVEQHQDASVSFFDSNQYMILGESALAELNERLEKPVPMDRFRPNIVFSGGEPHIEDQWKKIQINDSAFEAIKLCSRCQVITIDQTTGKMSKEPTATLAKYRVINHKVMFGLHLKLKHSRSKIIQVGNVIVLD